MELIMKIKVTNKNILWASAVLIMIALSLIISKGSNHGEMWLGVIFGGIVFVAILISFSL